VTPTQQILYIELEYGRALRIVDLSNGDPLVIRVDRERDSPQCIAGQTSYILYDGGRRERSQL
jgi:hypothetical protein